MIMIVLKFWICMSTIFFLIRSIHYITNGRRLWDKDLLIGLACAPLLLPTLAIGYSLIRISKMRVAQDTLATLRLLWVSVTTE